MELSSLSYKEHIHTNKRWEFENFKINNVNLIVGKNASGKSRIIRAINGLSKFLINPTISFSNGHYDVSFIQGTNNYNYILDVEDKVIQKEELSINNEIYITRNSDGIGEIKGEEAQSFIKFKLPKNQLAIVRRDEIQHPSLDVLYQWGISLRYFRFARDQEKESLIVPSTGSNEQDDTNDALAISIFQRGESSFGSKFVNSLISNMNEIGYEIESIEVGKMPDIKITSTPFPAELSGILIKEKNCSSQISQVTMSDGMFRALAILIHFNYYKLKKSSGTILIDDIGEGLDYERSSKLIKILVKDAENSNIQLIMSTNDKFIMNSVELTYWQIISRLGGVVKINNIHNSKKTFDQFKFTGLNNFDFFSSDFLNNSKEF